jgi:hypothetical protein
MIAHVIQGNLNLKYALTCNPQNLKNGFVRLPFSELSIIKFGISRGKSKLCQLTV